MSGVEIKPFATWPCIWTFSQELKEDRNGWPRVCVTQISAASVSRGASKWEYVLRVSNRFKKMNCVHGGAVPLVLGSGTCWFFCLTCRLSSMRSGFFSVPSWDCSLSSSCRWWGSASVCAAASTSAAEKCTSDRGRTGPSGGNATPSPSWSSVCLWGE